MTTKTAPLDTVTASCWEGRLSDLAAGLDLTDADDRASFRYAVFSTSYWTKRNLLVSLTRHFGGTVPGNATHPASARALAEAWIARSTA